MSRRPVQGGSDTAKEAKRLLIAFTWFFGEILLELACFTIMFFCVSRTVALLRNVRPDVGKLCVYLKPFLEAGLGIRLDGFCRALRFAHATVNALIGMNDEHVVAFIETVNRTYFNTVHVLALDAVLNDDIGHVRALKLSDVAFVRGCR